MGIPQTNSDANLGHIKSNLKIYFSIKIMRLLGKNKKGKGWGEGENFNETVSKGGEEGGVGVYIFQLWVMV